MAELILAQRHPFPRVFIYRTVNLIVSIIETALAVRFVLELLGASTSSQFIATVYEVTDRLLGPLAGAFSNFSLGGGFAIDFTAILGMIVYAILGWVIIQLLSFIFNSAYMT